MGPLGSKLFHRLLIYFLPYYGHIRHEPIQWSIEFLVGRLKGKVIVERRKQPRARFTWNRKALALPLPVVGGVGEIFDPTFTADATTMLRR